MKITLINPPYSDLTQPYHSCAYLAGHLIMNGFTRVIQRDLNIELFRYLAEPDSMEWLNREIDARFRCLDAAPALQFIQQEEYYLLVASRRLAPAQLCSSIAALRSAELFLDPEQYSSSVRTIDDFTLALSAISYPNAVWGHSLGPGRFSPYSLRDLGDTGLAGRGCSLVDRFFRARLADDETMRASDIFGISITHDAQLLAGVRIATLLRAAFPAKKIVLGGAAITQVVRRLRDKSAAAKLLAYCDAVVVGEGESALTRLADVGGDPSELENRANILACCDGDVCFPDEVYWEDLDALATPVYDVNWELYLSPARGIAYSPSRGCYWNRCAFCDHGLATGRPTAPYRERKVEAVAADLRAIAGAGFRFVYFAVDAVRPAYLDRVADAIIDAGIVIRWSTEIRMEPTLTADRCRKFAKSGCVAVSMGMESGSQRVLDRMNKGVKVTNMIEVLKNCADSGIAAQLMAFTDFPGETESDRERTWEFVRATEDHWAAGCLGRFGLSPGSVVAHDPAGFGIEIITPKTGDAVRGLAYRAPGSEVCTEFHKPSLSKPLFPMLPRRPWAGSIDAIHSLIYYAAKGRKAFKQPRASSRNAGSRDLDVGRPVEIVGALCCVNFDIPSIIGNRMIFNRSVLVDAATGGGPPTYAGFLASQASLGCLKPGSQASWWLFSSGRWHQLTDSAFTVLSASYRADISVSAALLSVVPESYDRVVEELRKLSELGAIRPK